MSKYGGFSGSYFLVFGLNTGKYEPEKTPYLDTFHAESEISKIIKVAQSKERISKNSVWRYGKSADIKEDSRRQDIQYVQIE